MNKIPYDEALAYVLTQRTTSTADLQNHFNISYRDAATFIDQMQTERVITEPTAQGKRNVIKKPKYSAADYLGSG